MNLGTSSGRLKSAYGSGRHRALSIAPRSDVFEASPTWNEEGLQHAWA